MLVLTPEQSSAVSDAVGSARGNSLLTTEIRDLYARVQAEIDVKRPRCDISGRCCRFESFGHRLFVTTAELAVFADGYVDRSPQVSDVGAASWNGFGCPFQVGGLCGIHAIRPFGCRIFFCDPAAGQWQQDAYESFHRELKAMHERFGLEYFYVEWREGLKAIGLATPTNS